MKRLSFALVTAALTMSVCGPQVSAFGKRGHAAVGALADHILVSKPTAITIATLLDGLTLEEAATLADEIKAWDFKTPATSPIPSLSSRGALEDELLAFVRANSARKPETSHHRFHFTDVPVAKGAKYSDGPTGRNDADLVKMIPYCVDILKGKKDVKEFKITRPVALILLVHLMGDIAQPLHVGSQYFDKDGKPVDPDVTKGQFFADTGGNDLTLMLLGHGTHGSPHGKFVLHTYWDDNAVDTAFEIVRADIKKDRAAAPIPDNQVTKRLAATSPPNVNFDPKQDIATQTVAWANATLPIAKEAHDRLDFEHVISEPNPHNPGRNKTSGQAVEKAGADRSYQDFAGEVVKTQIHTAGWRLAALLEAILE